MHHIGRQRIAHAYHAALNHLLLEYHHFGSIEPVAQVAAQAGVEAIHRFAGRGMGFDDRAVGGKAFQGWLRITEVGGAARQLDQRGRVNGFGSNGVRRHEIWIYDRVSTAGFTTLIGRPAA